jgi:malate dehydrogenase (oxaloacetate-decarboxylating)
MCYAAAEALAAAVGGGLDEEHLLPTMADWEVVPQVAAAVGLQAQAEGLARLHPSREDLLARARALITRSRDLTRAMMEQGFIPPAPEEDGHA